MKSRKALLDFIPFFVTAALSLTTLVIYLTALGGRDPVRIVEACAAPLVPLIIPAANKIFKVRLPFALNIAVTAFAVIAVDFASVLDFYSLIPYFDKFLHTSFGVLGAFCVCVFLLYGNAEKMTPWGFFITVFLCVMGLAALWEVYEYTAGAILNSDMQRWFPDMGAVGDMTVEEFFKNYNPLWDTMWDIIVAAFGVIFFFILLIIDKLCGYRVAKKVYAQIKNADG